MNYIKLYSFRILLKRAIREFLNHIDVYDQLFYILIVE